MSPLSNASAADAALTNSNIPSLATLARNAAPAGNAAPTNQPRMSRTQRFAAALKSNYRNCSDSSSGPLKTALKVSVDAGLLGAPQLLQNKIGQKYPIAKGKMKTPSGEALKGNAQKCFRESAYHGIDHGVEGGIDKAKKGGEWLNQDKKDLENSKQYSNLSNYKKVQRFRKLTELSQFFKRARGCGYISFFGGRRVFLLSKREREKGALSIDTLALKAMNLIRQHGSNLSEEDFLAGKNIVKEIDRLYRGSDADLLESNRFTRTLCKIRDFLKGSNSIRRRWINGPERKAFGA